MARQRPVPQPGPLERADVVVVHHDVGPADQAPDDLDALGALQVEGDAVLVAVGGGEVVAERVVEERGPGAAVVTGADALDLDDLRPVVGEQHGAERPGHGDADLDRKSTRLNSSHRCISYAVFCLTKT